MPTATSKNRANAQAAVDLSQQRDNASAPGVGASGSRRRLTDADGSASRFEVIRAAQIRAVGTTFLRARPLVVAPIAIINTLLVAASGAPTTQRAALGTAIGAALALFIAERWWLTRRAIGERWLAGSLVGTAAMLAIGCALSGGLASPMLPLVLAPIVVATAAFGRSRRAIAACTLAFALIVGLALLPEGTPFPRIAEPWARAMTVTSFLGLLLLSYAGVAGLVAAYVRAGEVLDRMRLATIEEAASRMRATEQVGAKVAHELKNPLAAIKALLQLLRDRVDAKGTKRLEVALAEVDRMDAIVRDYLSFARPLADLDLETIDLHTLAEDVIAVLEARAQLAGIELSLSGAPQTVIADARRVREALFNLTDNAVAATPVAGRVTITLGVAGALAQITIEDTGHGISAEQASAPAFTTTRADGTGLGLTIARAAIAQHGGTLTFTERPGGGTIAIMLLPFQLGAAT